MPNPTHSDLHISAALTDLSVAYSNEDMGTVYDKIFPVVTVQKQADKFFTYDRDSWFRSDARRRAPGAEVEVSGWTLSDDNYFCERYALGHDIDDPSRANADPAVQNLDADAVRFVTEHLRLRNEKDWVDNFFTTGVWSGASNSSDMDGSAAPASTSSSFLYWNDLASTPIEDIRGEMTSVAKKTARKPNKLTMGMQVWTALADHPDILDRIKYTERGVVTEDLLASLLGLDEVLVATMVESNRAEGSTDGSYDFVAGRNALLTFTPAAPGLRTPSAGYTFSWAGMAGAPGGQAPRIKRFRLERNESDRIEGEFWRDFKKIGADLGAFFNGAVSS